MGTAFAALLEAPEQLEFQAFLTCGECISAPHWSGEDTEAQNSELGCKPRWADCRAGKGGCDLARQREQEREGLLGITA